MSLPDLRVSMVQGDTAWHDPAGNRARYGAALAPLAGHTDLVVLPETFTSGFSNDALASAETMDGPTVAWLREQAAALGAVVTGSVQLRVGEGVYNRLLWATPDGELKHYDKRHLFRMAREHERYAAGRDRQPERPAQQVHGAGLPVVPGKGFDAAFPDVHADAEALRVQCRRRRGQLCADISKCPSAGLPLSKYTPLAACSPSIPESSGNAARSPLSA